MSKQTEKGDYHFAFVEYSLAASALNAMKELDGNMQYGDVGKPLRYFSFAFTFQLILFLRRLFF
jgi:hypothetical protein